MHREGVPRIAERAEEQPAGVVVSSLASSAISAAERSAPRRSAMGRPTASRRQHAGRRPGPLRRSRRQAVHAARPYRDGLPPGSRPRPRPCAGQVQLLDRRRLVAEPITLHKLGVEVLLAGAHAPGVQSEPWPHRVAGAVQIVRHVGVDYRAPYRIRPASDRRAWRPPPAALGTRRRGRARRTWAASRRLSLPPTRCSSGRSRGQVDRHPLLHRRDHQLQRLSRPSGSGSSRVSPWNSRRSRASAIRTTVTYSRVRWSWRAKRCPCHPSAT